MKHRIILKRPQHAGMTLARSERGIPSGGVRGMRGGERCWILKSIKSINSIDKKGIKNEGNKYK